VQKNVFPFLEKTIASRSFCIIESIDSKISAATIFHKLIIMDEEWQDALTALEKMPRRGNRMVAVQALYMWDVSRSTEEKAIDQFFKDLPGDTSRYAFGKELVQGVLAHLEEVDQQIKQYAQNWSFQRIAKVDLAILRLAVYELLFRQDIPPIVSINEALELAKLLSHPEAKRFINGMLDQIKGTLKRSLREASE
jgi:transcription antitermination protein NusB